MLLFTDGGICSNFPIHFYDSPLPRWPTLAIALDSSGDPARGSVTVDRTAEASAPSAPPRKLADALGRIFQTAGGWRDQVQTSLPGYRERVCTVRLTKALGGFNFEMARDDVAGAMLLGRDAGTLLCGENIDGPDRERATPFDEEEHRYRRFLVAYARLEETLDGLARTWLESSDAWRELAQTHVSPEIEQSADQRAAIALAVSAIQDRAELLKAPIPPLRMRYNVPQPPTNLRVTPRE